LNISRVQQTGAVTIVWLAESSGTLDLMLMSDLHFDSKYCRRSLYKKHLEKAMSMGAYVIGDGDHFDAMQGRFDPRRSYDEIRPEYVDERYYDLIVEDSTNFHMPYKDSLLLFGRGNHDTSIIRHANTDLLSRMVGNLRSAGSRVVSGGYGGWVVFHFGEKYRACYKLRYHHGAGGAAPVTRGVMDAARQAVYLPDADMILNGHNHKEYVLTDKLERISSKGKQYFSTRHSVRTPGYKDEYQDGSAGYSVENNSGPTPQGCVWAKIEVSGGQLSCHCTDDVS
jgi:hypothetical protein